MAYATLAAVQARAGRLSTWTADTNPSTTQIGTFLDDVAAEMDALITGRGFTLPEAGSAGALALRGVNADGALVLALEATYPAGTGPNQAPDLLDTVRERYAAARELLVSGTHPALDLLDATGTGPSASSFWQDEPAFDPLLLPERVVDRGLAGITPVYRGRSL